MKAKIRKHTNLLAIIFVCLINLAILTGPAFAEETYAFERMWPVLRQPWYFNHPVGIAISKTGNIHVADSFNHRVQKFSSNGELITKWGKEGTGDGEFKLPSYIAIDKDDNIYVTDSHNHWVQKFDSDGKFIKKMGD